MPRFAPVTRTTEPLISMKQPFCNPLREAHIHALEAVGDEGAVI
jgi:hypothetical protein